MADDRVLELTTENFDRALKNLRDGLLVVDFWAEWCHPCKMLEPHLKRLVQEYDSVVLGKLNTDENPEVAARFGVMSIPTLIFFKGGKEVDRLIGAVPYHVLKNKVEELL